ncbi:MAG: hypothetical protein QW478_10460 [Candidatus Micrarchaeaceae archaeon]
MSSLIGFTPQLSPTGDFTKVYDIASLIQDLIAYLSISQGTYAFNPNLGSNLNKYIFEQLDSLVYTSVKNDITYAISKLSPNLQLIGNINLARTSDGKGLVVSFTVGSPTYSENVSLLITESNILNMSYLNV